MPITINRKSLANGGTISGSLGITGNITVTGTGTNSLGGTLTVDKSGGGILNINSTTGTPGAQFEGNTARGLKLYTNVGISTKTALIASETGAVSIQGTTTNDNAATGYIGEFLSSTVAAGSAVSLTTATAVNITSLPLTAGDWDVTGVTIFSQGPSTVGQQYIGSISTTTGTVSTTETNNAQTSALTSTNSLAGNLTLPTVRLSIASTTTIYLVAKATFTTDTMSGYGTIRVRRIH